jgi:hypothetical protein
MPERCDCVVQHPSDWPEFRRCPNWATVILTGGSHEGHKMCHGHLQEWKDEAELDGYEELG